LKRVLEKTGMKPTKLIYRSIERLNNKTNLA
jgi:hypothetical protein